MTDDPENYYEALQTEIDELIDDLAGDTEPIVEAELHRNNAYALMTACSVFGFIDGPDESDDAHESRVEVASNITAILDSQIRLSAMAVADLPPDNPDAGVADVHVRLPKGMATVAAISTFHCFMAVPRESAMEHVFGNLLASLTDEWPDINDKLESQVTELLADLDSEEEAPGFTNIDISGTEEDDDDE